MTTITHEPLLTRAEVAAMFRVDPKTVTRWAKVPLVEATGSRRRLQALGYMGHSVESLSSHLDEPEDLMRRVQDGRVDQIPVGVAALISAAYDALWNVDGGDEHAAWLARGRRYAPPLAWDDNPGDSHWIDDPGCPASMWQRRGSPGPRICGQCETAIPPQRSLCESCVLAASARACERCGRSLPGRGRFCGLDCRKAAHAEAKAAVGRPVLAGAERRAVLCGEVGEFDRAHKGMHWRSGVLRTAAVAS